MASWRQAIGARRRMLSAGFAALAVAAMLQALAPARAPGVVVLVAARDLAAGTVLSSGDVRSQTWPADLAPRHRLKQAAGELLTAVRAGEPLTDTRIRGSGLLRGQDAGIRWMALRLADPMTGLLRAGSRVDILAGPADLGAAALGAGGAGVGGDGVGSGAGSGAGAAFVAAENVLVLAVGAPSGAVDDVAESGVGGVLSGAGAGGGGSGDASGGDDTVIVAVSTETALRLRSAASGRTLSVLVRD